MLIFSNSKLLRSGFSLVEVVVAVGIFAIAIVAVIGMLAPLGKSVGNVRDGDDASRVAAVIQSGLQAQVASLRASFPANYWDVKFAEYIDATNGMINGDKLYASRDGSKIGLGNSTATWDTNGTAGIQADENSQKFFEIILQRNTTLSPKANDATVGFLAFTIELRWPGYSGDGVALTGDARQQQSQLLLPAAVTR